MIEAQPQSINATKADLRSLATALTGYTISGQYEHISAVWLWRGDDAPLLVTSDSRDIVFKFEVFTLAIQASFPISRESQREASDRMVKWPFSEWQVDVIWIRDWTITIEALPDGWYDRVDDRSFGEVPAGAGHACLVAKALLFTGADGCRLVIDQGAMPLDLYVTNDPAFIDKRMLGAMKMPLDLYLAGVVPTIEKGIAKPE